MKVVKILLKAALVLVALVVVALLTLPVWFGPVVKTVANTSVPKVVKTDFHLGHLSLNPYTARFELGDMQLWNPAGYSEKFAATVGDIAFDADTMSLMTDVIHIEEIKVKDVFVSYVSGGENGVNNFTQIQYNVAGGKDKYEAAQAEKKTKAEVEAKVPQEKKDVSAPEADKPSKKVIIDKLTISGISIKLGILPIRIPVDVNLTDIGKKSGGATLEEAWQQILEGVMKAAGVAGDQLKALGNMGGEAAKQLGNAAAAATESATKAASAATESATKAASAVTGSATKAAESATKAVGDAAGKATEAAGKATEAAGKALDSLKKLW